MKARVLRLRLKAPRESVHCQYLNTILGRGASNYQRTRNSTLSIQQAIIPLEVHSWYSNQALLHSPLSYKL